MRQLTANTHSSLDSRGVRGRAQRPPCQQCCPQALGAGGLRAGELRAGEPIAGQLRAGELTAGGLRAGELTAEELRAGELRAEELRAGEPRAGGHRAGELRAGGLRAGGLRAGELRAGGLRAGKPRAGEERAGPPDSPSVWGFSCQRRRRSSGAAWFNAGAPGFNSLRGRFSHFPGCAQKIERRRKSVVHHFFFWKNWFFPVFFSLFFSKELRSFFVSFLVFFSKVPVFFSEISEKKSINLADKNLPPDEVTARQEGGFLMHHPQYCG